MRQSGSALGTAFNVVLGRTVAACRKLGASVDHGSLDCSTRADKFGAETCPIGSRKGDDELASSATRSTAWPQAAGPDELQHGPA